VQTIEIGEAGPGMHFLAIEWAPGEILEKYAEAPGADAGRRGRLRS
jgi:hypothetical protein